MMIDTAQAASILRIAAILLIIVGIVLGLSSVFLYFHLKIKNVRRELKEFKQKNWVINTQAADKKSHKQKRTIQNPEISLSKIIDVEDEAPTMMENGEIVSEKLVSSYESAAQFLETTALLEDGEETEAADIVQKDNSISLIDSDTSGLCPAESETDEEITGDPEQTFTNERDLHGTIPAVSFQMLNSIVCVGTSETI